MNERKFIRLLIFVAIVGLALTAAHVAYIYTAYQKSSIIQFVARELWL